MSINVTSMSRTTTISSLHTDIIELHILTTLDGQTLAAVSCVNTTLHSLTDDNKRLWSDVCYSMWPSTSSELGNRIVSSFSNDGNDNGPRVFFSESFPLASPDPTTFPTSTSNCNRLTNPTPIRLISAVDIYYRNKVIFSKIEETETISNWFQCSPFRIDLLDPKDIVPTEIQYPHNEETCMSLNNDMSLSWILIDPISKRAVNLSSHKPISVQRHWLSGEIQVRFASILAGGAHNELVQGGIVMNCGRSEKGEMQLRELSLEVEDMDGKHLNGRDSLVILQRVMEGKRGKGVKRENEARNRCKKFEEMKRERKERKLRVEGTLDTLSVAFGLSIFAGLFFIFC